jgi:hypothetical protein
LERYLRKCTVTTTSISTKQSSQQVFAVTVSKQSLGSRQPILLHFSEALELYVLENYHNKYTALTSWMFAKNKAQPTNLRRLLFPNKFRGMKTNIVACVLKHWHWVLWKGISINALYERHRCLLKGSINLFSSVIVSKHMLGHENKYCCICS